MTDHDFHTFFGLAYSATGRCTASARQALQSDPPSSRKALRQLVEAARHAGEAEMCAGMFYGDYNAVPGDIRSDISRLDASIDQTIDLVQRALNP
jgi:hypothetical protein